MKRVFLLPIIWLCAVTFVACNDGYEGRDTFIKDFEKRSMEWKDTQYLSIFNDSLSQEQLESLQFLYAYMPSPDITDYSGEFHLKNVDYALKARAEMPWGKNVPDREFLHFVLPVRVNNENLDTCRMVFYEELKERICNMSMYDAVLEVNHWCHEKVTYTPSDARTSSPLATIRTAHGRCGEESTFTVSALRAVGIPARQVYTPRWVHTDNNHAWVEAWVDGEWYFLGACEPSPVLNMGWFNAPASRGILMNTYVFGKYQGPEEQLSQNACYTEINVISNYAPAATTQVQVVDENGVPVANVDVEFKVYNYAEFYTIARKRSDDNGYTSLTSGCGDIIAWAAKDGKYGFSKYSAGRDNDVKIVLDKSAGYKATMELDIVPPVGHNNLPVVSPEQTALNDRRMAQEDSLRNTYVATFPTTEQVVRLAQELGLDEKELVRIIKESRGNYATIIEFLRSTSVDMRHYAVNMLNAISEKDRRDVPLSVLTDHFAHINITQCAKDYYFGYVLNPRISNEMLTPYRSFFDRVITEDEKHSYRTNPMAWIKWCTDSIQVDNTWNPRGFCMSPQGVWTLRTTDSHSRDIFFVASARYMGIPARIDEVTGKTQYLSSEGKWIDVLWGEDVVENATGMLRAQYSPSQYIDNPRYYTHFALSKIVNGRLELQNYPEDATWESLLKNGTTIDTGDYLLMTGTRMSNGSVMAHLDFIEICPNEVEEVELVLCENKDRLQVIGEFNSENLFYDLKAQQQHSLLSATGRGYYIIALVAPNNEPTNHFLRDIAPCKQAIDEWGQKIVLLFSDPNSASRFDVSEFANLPENIVWGTDINSAIYNEIVAGMKLQSPTYPIIIVADTFNRIVFLSEGYSIGLGEQLVKVINQL